jgi:hypothetical protein
MSKGKHSEAEVIGALKQLETGRRVADRQFTKANLDHPSFLQFVQKAWDDRRHFRQSKSLFACALADPKYVPVRVPHVHLADVPRHVGRRESDV